MEKILLLIAVCVLSINAVSAQKHRYLLHTDANISRLKAQIKTDPEVKLAWEHQLQKAEDLLKRERSGAPDLQELGLAYRMTGDARFAERIKQTLLQVVTQSGNLGGAGFASAHTSMERWFGNCTYQFLCGYRVRLRL